jgi:Flp pilus assembly protein TadG
MRFLHRLWQARQGAVLAEFALSIPFLVLLCLGSIEVGRYILLNVKLEQAASSMADLASREETLSAGQLDALFAAVRNIAAPFGFGANGVVIVSAVGTENNDPPWVYWQRVGGGGLAATSMVGSAGGEASLPATLTLREGETVIVSELFFEYRPWLANLVPETVLRKAAFYRPRLGALQTLQ